MKKIYIFLFLLALLNGCASAPVNVAIDKLPESDEKYASHEEKELGNIGYYFFVLNFKLVDDVPTLNRIKRLGARLTHYTERTNLEYKYFIIDSKYRNAFSLPDGYIFITNSMIETVQSDDKLAAILAHEIAHITHKHAYLSYKRLKGAGPLRSILGKDVLKAAREVGYNQAYELQADQTSLRYLYRAGLEPKIALEMLEQFKIIEKEDEEAFEKDQKEQKKKIKKEEMLLTHPPTENRIANMRNYLAEVYKTEKVQYNSKDFNF